MRILDRVRPTIGLPQTVGVDNEPEFAGRPLDQSASGPQCYRRHEERGLSEVQLRLVEESRRCQLRLYAQPMGVMGCGLMGGIAHACAATGDDTLKGASRITSGADRPVSTVVNRGGV